MPTSALASASLFTSRRGRLARPLRMDSDRGVQGIAAVQKENGRAIDRPFSRRLASPGHLLQSTPPSQALHCHCCGAGRTRRRWVCGLPGGAGAAGAGSSCRQRATGALRARAPVLPDLLGGRGLGQPWRQAAHRDVRLQREPGGGAREVPDGLAPARRRPIHLRQLPSTRALAARGGAGGAPSTAVA